VNIDSSTPVTPTNVTSLPGRPQGDTGAETPASTETTPTTGATTTAAGSSVSLSALSTNLLSLGSSSSDDVDLTRVNAIRTSLANGTLQVNPGKIADGMLHSASALLQRS
jgi:negative regulator of flagellin synthesis FlgM